MGSGGSTSRSSSAKHGTVPMEATSQADDITVKAEAPRPPPKHVDSSKKEAWGMVGTAATLPTTSLSSFGSPPSMAPSEGLVLAADVGGTNSRFMLYLVDSNEPIENGKEAPGKLLVEMKYANIRYGSFVEVFGAFIDDATVENLISAEVRPEVACLAVAGVVEANTCRLTNLDWIIDGSELEKQFDIGDVEIINDFVAQGYGVLTLGKDEVIHLHGPQSPVPSAPIACVGAGTGLGQCFLTAGYDGQYQAFPSEGGHAEFAPRGAGNDETQIDLLRYLKIKFSGWNRISFERVVSGKGICNTYEFLAWKNPERIDKKVHKEFCESRQNAGIVAQNAQPGTLCHEALQIFADCYGAVCGTFALQVMPFGGFYISGGVTQKLLSFLQDTPHFMEAYLDKGRVNPMLQDIPLYVVKGDNMGQRGAHLRSARLFNYGRQSSDLRPSSGLASRSSTRSKVRSVNRVLCLVPPRNSQIADLVKELKPEEVEGDGTVRRSQSAHLMRSTMPT